MQVHEQLALHVAQIILLMPTKDLERAEQIADSAQVLLNTQDVSLCSFRTTGVLLVSPGIPIHLTCKREIHAISKAQISAWMVTLSRLLCRDYIHVYFWGSKEHTDAYRR